MSRLKVMTILGTRPEIIRLSRVMAVLDRDTEHLIVHTGQNFDRELSQIFFDELHLRQPDFHLGAGSATPIETIARVLVEADRVLEAEKPDAVLILGDTNSCLAAYAAKRRRIPIFHMEAGNRCFDQRVPEEINRRIVDHVADINLPYSAIARDYLIAEGFPPDRVIRTGSPLFEVLDHYRADIERSDVLERLGIAQGSYFVCSFHRQENVDDDARLLRIAATLDAVANEYGLPILVSTHPRSRARIDALGVAFHPLVRLMKPQGYFDYCKLQINARAVISDSGTISEEAAILGLAAVNLRDTHERPEAMEQGIVPMAGIGSARVLQALAMLFARTSPPRMPADYDVPDVSEKVVRIILSYVDYVRRTVWHEF